MKELLIVYLVWNLAVALFYGIDKSRAIRSARRISEKSLILAAFAMGGVGAMFGMVWFNHKTSKPKFRILVPVAVIVQIAAIWYVFYMGGIV